MAHPKIQFVVGIDEVGRGCLAGPVTVVAVAAPANLKFKIKKFLPAHAYRQAGGRQVKLPLRDSKKLTARQREAWFEYVKTQPRILRARANVYPKTIDRINISKAANLAATRAVKKVIKLLDSKLLSTSKIYLDGGLYLNIKALSASGYALNPRTVIRGDEKFNSVKLASIVAKVSRDKIMKRNHGKFPQYGFDEHVGYGTKKHIAAIKKHGICKLHRLTFVKNFV